MKRSRGRWAQLGGLPGGRLVVQGGQRLREHGSDVPNPLFGGATRNVASLLQPKSTRLLVTRLQAYQDFKDGMLHDETLELLKCYLLTSSFPRSLVAHRGPADR